MENEIWKDIKGYEGLYQVSNFGIVKSLDRYVNNRYGNGLSFRKSKILSYSINSFGYYGVSLCKNGKVKSFRVHRLVWEAFNGKIPNGMQINHLDEKPENNRLENLELVTPKENINYGTRNKKVSYKLINNNPRSKTVLQFDLNGNILKEWISTGEVERQTNYDRSLIQKCCSKHIYNKSAYGYIWKYKEDC